MMHLLSYKDLVARGIVRNRVTLQRWIKHNGFPKPIQIGPNTIAFSATEVDLWLSARASQRSQAA